MQATDNIQSGIVGTNVVSPVSKPLFIKDGRKLLHIVKHHVVYLTSDGHVCNLYMKGRRAPIVLSESFKNLARKLGDVLTKVRRGLAVNMHYVTSIEDGALKLAWDDQEAELAYSKDNYKNILSAIDLLE